MRKVARRAWITMILIAALLLGFSCFIGEFVANSGDWVIFPASPHVYNGGNIGCGGVTDREGIKLLDTTAGRSYSSDSALRKATIHWLGDRNGRIDAPAISHYAAELAGFDLLNGVYAYERVGGVAQLTLSAVAQKAALEAMGNYKGTVAVYNYKTGELLCAVTTPTFDPDSPPDVEGTSTDAYEGIYYNRFTQAEYTPGSIFKIVTLAAALDHIEGIQQQRFSCSGSFSIGADQITCEYAHYDQDLRSAFRNSCNCAFAQIAQQLGSDTLQKYADKLGVTKALSFDGVTTAAGNFQLTDAAEVSLAWSAIGQYTDQINPCVFLQFVGAVANDGVPVRPYLIEKISVDAEVTYRASAEKQGRVLSKETAETLQEYMRYNVVDKYGADNFPGLTVCAKTGTAEVGGGKRPNAVLTGFVKDEQYPLAFIVVAEDAGYGSEVCIPIASKVLEACKKALS